MATVIDQAALGRIAAFWTAHLNTPVSGADVAVTLRLAELAAEKPLDTTGSA